MVIYFFLLFFFQNFSVEDFTSYELIKDNRDTLEGIKNNNIILSSILFFLFTILWVLLLGFGTPIFLTGGFIFGKWLGTLLVVFGLSSGATLLYIFANFFLKEIVKKNFLIDLIFLQINSKKMNLFFLLFIEIYLVYLFL